MAEDKDTSTIRDALADMFGLLEYKVRNNVMSSDDMRAILTALEEGGGIRATIHDIAVYYGNKDVDVRNVIHRNYLPKPVRRVTYDFGKFRRIMPKSWRSIHSLPADQ